ncbi:hypothetical protein FB451DRAFT_1478575 [Mycena latifolia]|nr:hypothetical protein FB451DRAFT_1478575 [Mycena latifolia]
MPLPRIFCAALSQDWLSPLIVVSKGLVPTGNYVPFPYVNIALSAGLALLETPARPKYPHPVQTAGKSSDDLRYLAQSVVTIMQLLREEMDHHSTAQDTRFRQLCIELTKSNTRHLAQLSKDIEALSRNRSSSKSKKYMNSQTIRDQSTDFTQRVQDTRANTTLVAAIGTRMDLVKVANGVAVVEPKNFRYTARSKRASVSNSNEMIFTLRSSPPTAEFFEIDTSHRQERKIGWTDYRTAVKGSIRTIQACIRARIPRTFPVCTPGDIAVSLSHTEDCKI